MIVFYAGDDWGSDFLLYFCLGAGFYVVGTIGYNHKVKQLTGNI